MSSDFGNGRCGPYHLTCSGHGHGSFVFCNPLDWDLDSHLATSDTDVAATRRHIIYILTYFCMVECSISLRDCSSHGTAGSTFLGIS